MRKIYIFLLALLSWEMPIVASAKPSLVGTKASLAAEVRAVTQKNLKRIKDDAGLADAKRKHILVPLPVNKCLTVNSDLVDQKFRFVLPKVRDFLLELSGKYCRKFGGAPLVVNSAVRTEKYQKNLRTVNSNAAPVGRTSHTTGATVDLKKLDVPEPQVAWLRSELLRLEGQSRVHATEESGKHKMFHVMVIR